MFPHHTCDSAGNSALRLAIMAVTAHAGSIGGFLLGGSCAAVLVLTFAGASLALSQASAVNMRANGASEFRLHLLPRPQLSLDSLA
jgi:hypothetical protein